MYEASWIFMSKNVLDCQNLPCPEPVLLTKQYLSKHNPITLIVIVDNNAAKENVTRFLQSQQYSVTALEKNNVWYLEATGNITSSLPDTQENTPTISSTAPQEEKIVVVITGSVIGQGSEELGAKLMKNFLTTLPEMGPSLWRIIMLNGGVLLSSKTSLVIGALQKLEQEGVTILVCGTCLEHYGIFEQIAVGQTTNMLDVVTSMQLATKTITL